MIALAEAWWVALTSFVTGALIGAALAALVLRRNKHVHITFDADDSVSRPPAPPTLP
jgi:hypothetical protein